MPRFLSLEPTLRCPNRRCRRLAYERDPESYLGALRCLNKQCGAHWWAMLLRPGDVRRQIIDELHLRDRNAEYLADEMMAIYGLPDRIDGTDPMFWQIWLSGNEFYRYTHDKTPGPFGRTASLFRHLIGLLRPRASA